MFDTLKKLVDADSISGYEENIQEALKKELKKHVDEVKLDRVGNVIARKGKGSPVVMFAAHMDEIGLIVKYIDKEGFIFFDKIGGWDERILPTRKVVIHGSKGSVFGVIGSKPAHLLEKEEQKKPAKLKEMFIDIGASSEGGVKKAGISIGDYITNFGSVEKLLGSKVTGHGFDNRLGCLTIIEAAKGLKRFKGTAYFVGTVKEEIGLIGVRGSAFSVNPDVLLAVDTGMAGDVPGISKAEVSIKLSEGPALDIKDAMSVVHPKVKKWVKETASRNKIKLQFDVMSGGATDASIAPTIREGIPSGAITVPARYIHTPVEVADMKVVESAVKLCVKLAESAHKYF
ncbi:MAG: M42 family metallopeptidase [Candidatus Aenigmatarchaeota archaeon]|nr:MAG: M42 family metallopeptidase [Candidatus Aenigmarchaeota archaeon]